MQALRLSITAEGPVFPPGQLHRFVELARLADELGVDHLDINEHVLTGVNAPEQDPFRLWRNSDLDMNLPEPITLLSAMAGATRRVRFGTSVLIAPLRPAGLLAKMVATLHGVSQGRFVLGVSSGWLKDEFDALGVSFAERGQLLEDAVRACRVLWSEAPAELRSPTVSFGGMYCQPRPQPGERIPVWFGGKFTPRLVRRIVELGDGWIPYSVYGMTIDDYADCIARLRAAFVAAGREPSTLSVAVGIRSIDGDLARSMEQVPQMAEAGINVIRVNLRRFTREAEGPFAAVEAIVKAFATYHQPTA